MNEKLVPQIPDSEMEGELVRAEGTRGTGEGNSILYPRPCWHHTDSALLSKSVSLKSGDGASKA